MGLSHAADPAQAAPTAAPVPLLAKGKAVDWWFCYAKVKYRGLAKNTANLVTLFALSNLYMVRKPLLNMGAQR